MSVNVPNAERTPSMLRMLVGQPVSGTGPQRWNDDLDFLSVGMGEPVVAMANMPLVALTPHLIRVPYCKSPGIKALRIAIEVNVASGSGTVMSMLTCAVTCTGTVAWMDSSASLFLDGSQNINSTFSVLHDFPITVNYLDVSALTDGTTYDLKFTVTDTSTTPGITRGLYSINVTEVPLADVDPVGAPTTEVGADSAWLQSNDRNRIVDGTTSLSYGMERIANGLEQARYQHRRHICLFCYGEDDTVPLALDVTNTAAGTALPFGLGANPTHRIRSRNLYGGSNPHTVWIRYKHNAAGVTTTFRLAVSRQDGVGGATNTDITLANSTVWATATAAVNLPTASATAGSLQECTIVLSGWNSAGSKHCYLSAGFLIENET